MTMLVLHGSACSVTFTRFAFLVKILAENLKKIDDNLVSRLLAFWMYGSTMINYEGVTRHNVNSACSYFLGRDFDVCFHNR